jgi:hypothetical protein
MIIGDIRLYASRALAILMAVISPGISTLPIDCSSFPQSVNVALTITRAIGGRAEAFTVYRAWTE